MRLGVALGGGIARGIAHIGVLQALVAAGFRPAVVAGTSAGALVGALYAAGLSPAEMEQAAHSIQWRTLVRLRLRRDGLLDASGLERFLQQYIGDIEFTELSLPFACVACDLLTGEEVVLQSGPVTRAVRASSAFPGLFLPVLADGRYYVDGGVVNNVPVSVCRALGADVVLAVDLNRVDTPTGRKPRNLVDVMLTSLSVLQTAQVAAAVATADLAVRPYLATFSPLELVHIDEMIAEGRRAMVSELPKLEALLGGGEPA